MKCSNCHASIDNNRNKCPYCGVETNRNVIKGFLNVKTYIYAILLIIILAGIFYLGEYIDAIYRCIIALSIVALVIVIRKIKEKSFVPVTGKIVDFSSSNIDANQYSYQIIIEYEFNTEVYRKVRTISYYTYLKKDNYLDGEVSVLVNPNKPIDSRAKLSRSILGSYFVKDYILEISFIIILFMLFLTLALRLYS